MPRATGNRLKLAALLLAAACASANTTVDRDLTGPARTPIVAEVAGSGTAEPLSHAGDTAAFVAISTHTNTSSHAGTSSAGTSAASRNRHLVIEAPYWATPQAVVEKMLELANVQPSDLVYDLGCGDARSLVTAAKRYGARGLGFDIDARRVDESRENVRRNGVEDLVQIALRDIFFVDLSRADVVFLFMLERMNAHLLPQLEKMRPGSRIVAHEFPVPGIRPDRIVRVMAPPDGPPDAQGETTPKSHVLYLWRAPWKRTSQ